MGDDFMAASIIDTNVKFRDTLNHGNDSNVIVDILVRANLATYDKGILYLKPPAEDGVQSNTSKIK